MRKFVDSTAIFLNSQTKPVSGDWPTIGLILFLTYACVLGLYWTTFVSMVEVWRSFRTFAHGFLVLPAACYLIYCFRHRLVSLIPAPSAWGVLALALTAGGWIAGRHAGQLWIQQLFVVAMLPALVWAILGTEIVRVLLWPLGFLGFMLPFGAALEAWLQDFTVGFILIGLHAIGIPYKREGYLISLPSGTWEVARDCGGLRYVLPGLALGYAFTTLIYQRPTRRIAFLVVCAVFLILANGIRAFGIVAGDHLGVAEGTDHRVFSYSIYGVTLLMLFRLGLNWKDTDSLTPSSEGVLREHRRLPVRQTAVMAFGALALLALAPAVVLLLAL